MKLLIYRDRQTKQISNYHEPNKFCTDIAIKNWNEDENKRTTIEILELDEVAQFFYDLKTKSLKDEYEELQDLKERISDISYAVESRITHFEERIKELEE